MNVMSYETPWSSIIPAIKNYTMISDYVFTENCNSQINCVVIKRRREGEEKKEEGEGALFGMYYHFGH